MRRRPSLSSSPGISAAGNHPRRRRASRLHGIRVGQPPTCRLPPRRLGRKADPPAVEGSQHTVLLQPIPPAGQRRRRGKAPLLTRHRGSPGRRSGRCSTPCMRGRKIPATCAVERGSPVAQVPAHRNHAPQHGRDVVRRRWLGGPTGGPWSASGPGRPSGATRPMKSPA